MMRSRENKINPEGKRVEDGGNKLIEALENYIVPLIQGSIAQDKGKHASGSSGLTSEAIDFLAALQKFVVSLTAKNVPLEVRDVVNHPATVAELFSTPFPLIVAARAPLPTWILEKARHWVFNIMPIRLLAFNADGTGVRLIERPEILRIVLQRIEENFYRSEGLFNTDPDDNIFGDIFVRQFLDRHCAYAILSHTWLRESPGEVTYTDWTTKTFDPNGYRKLEMFCRVSALNHGMTLAWMDTCCIDKSSSSELDESIRSMFRWYESSAVCITYLADTMALQDMHNDTWFTRGWTLQELIAPKVTKFYGKDWKYLTSRTAHVNDKEDIEILGEIIRATRITKDELSQMHRTTISRRMQWAADRKVTKEEDMAYSLMGIFNVSFSTAYGEGAETDFRRLIQEILSANHFRSGVLDIVNWGYGTTRYFTDAFPGLVPTHPEYYFYAVPNIRWYEPYEPVVSTPLGLRVSVLIMPALGEGRGSRFYEFRSMFSPKGAYYGIADIADHLLPGGTRSLIERYSYPPLDHSSYNVLDARLFDPNESSTFTTAYIGNKISKSRIFGVLNFGESETTVYLTNSQVCFTLVLENKAQTCISNEDTTLTFIPVEEPVTFKLQTVGGTKNDIKILKKDLHIHGMTLRTMYL